MPSTAATTGTTKAWKCIVSVETQRQAKDPEDVIVLETTFRNRGDSLPVVATP